MTIDLTNTYDALHKLGLTANYTGFFYLAAAAGLAAEEPKRLLLVTKWLYPDIAKQYHTNWKAVERGIRYAILRIWAKNTPLLPYVLNTPLTEKPKPACFIAMLARFCASSSAA